MIQQDNQKKRFFCFCFFPAKCKYCTWCPPRKYYFQERRRGQEEECRIIALRDGVFSLREGWTAASVQTVWTQSTSLHRALVGRRQSNCLQIRGPLWNDKPFRGQQFSPKRLPSYQVEVHSAVLCPPSHRKHILLLFLLKTLLESLYEQPGSQNSFPSTLQEIFKSSEWRGLKKKKNGRKHRLSSSSSSSHGISK